jgi:hypothetical protein
MYSMFRKTKNKTYNAFRGGNSGLKSPNRGMKGTIEEEDGGYDNSSETPRASSRRSPKKPQPELGESNRYNIEPANSFYFSPQNSWHESQRRFGTIDGEDVPQSPGESGSDFVEHIVSSVEGTLRKLVACCFIFIAGSIYPSLAKIVQKVLELTLVAWGTCLAIISLAWYQQSKQAREQTNNANAIIHLTRDANKEVSEPPRVQRNILLELDDEDEDRDAPKVGETDLTGKRSHEEVNMIKMSPLRLRRKSSSFMPDHLEQLEQLYVMLVGDQERISPNGVAVKVDNDLFYGDMLLMFRTSDADEPVGVNESDDIIANYFRGKQRRFEFQWQIKLKKVPPGDVFLGCELDEPISMGMIQRALVNTALKFVKKTNQGFSYVLSDSADNPSYLSFPLGTSMDRFVASKPGEAIPELGKEIPEDPDVMKKRKKGTHIQWNTEDVYTMALWSAYFDWLDWRIMNFPGIRPFSATSVAGVQPIKLTVYTEDELADKSIRRDISFTMEVSNATESTLGREAKEWKAKEMYVERQPRASNRALGYDSDEDQEDDNSDDEEEEELLYDDTMDLDDSEGGEEMDIDESLLGDDVYLVSGSPVLLREGTGHFVSCGGGYAVLQSSSTSAVVLEKVFRSKKTFAYSHRRNVSNPTMVIRSGDVVRVKLVDPATKMVKYLCIHRGWWLRWTSNRPKKNGSFYIRDSSSSTIPLAQGSPFSLESRKWSNYLVGACVESSAKFGGRMLGIYKSGKSFADGAPDEEDDEALLDDIYEKIKPQRMMPLLLCAEVMETSEDEYLSPAKSPSRRTKPAVIKEDEEVTLPTAVTFDAEKCSVKYDLDVPVWLEVMNRTRRTKQLVYAVRVNESSLQETTRSDNFDDFVPSDVGGSGSIQPNQHSTNVFVKLRTGRELAPILSLGLQYKKELSSSNHLLQLTQMGVKSEGDTQRSSFDDALEHADSDSSSSDDDSDSDDELMDEEQSEFVIAGPGHSDDEIETDAVDDDDGYAKVFVDDFNESKLGRVSPSEACDFDPSSLFSEDAVLNTNEKAKRKNFSIMKQTPKMKRFHSIEDDTAVNDDGTRNRSIDSRLAATTPRSNVTSDEIEIDSEGIPSVPVLENMDKKKSKTKHTAVLNRVAKTVKSSTVITGKQVIKQSKNLGKVTVSTGRAAG